MTMDASHRESFGTREPTRPAARLTKRRLPSPIWLVPLLALGVVVYLAITSLAHRGETIVVTFKSADGITARETQVRFRSVPLGTVEDVRLSDDMRRVVVHLKMNREAKKLLTDHTKFWVVRPRLTAQSVTGLETIVSGSFIALDPGAPGGAPRRTFEGLEEPPGVRSDEPGREVVLVADRLGSLTAGAPVFFRDVAVGELLSFDLGDGTGNVTLRAFVRAPYDRFVRGETRFWNASGLSLTMGAEGMRVELESLQSALSGAIAFDTPHDGGEPAPAGTSFQLYEDRESAEASRFTRTVPCVTYVHGSVAGLARGASVELAGKPVGAVTDVRLVYDAATKRIAARVAFMVQPDRALVAGDAGGGSPEDAIRAVLAVPRMRAVIETGNMLTQQKVVAIRSVPGRKPIAERTEGDAIVLEAEGAGMNDVTSALADVAAKLNEIPFADIGRDLDRAIRSVSGTMESPELRSSLESLAATLQDVRHLAREADRGATPALERLPHISEQLGEAAEKANRALGEGGYGASSDFQRNAGRMMREIGEAARSVRMLADLLQRHPEAVLRGRDRTEKK